MIFAYVWKCDRARGWTTAFYNTLTQKYDCKHFDHEQTCHSWLQREASGYILLDVQDFLRKLNLYLQK
jgi:hypothetical protein